MSLPSNEEWRPVLGFEGRYDVSNLGRVRSWAWQKKRGAPRLRTISPDRLGYLPVGLWDGSKRCDTKVHVLVAQAFLGPRPVGQVIRHLDGNPANNDPSNLAYGTPAENTADMLRHGNHVNIRKTHCARGHIYDDENTHHWLRNTGKPSRRCRACGRENARAYRAAKSRTS